MPESNSHSKTIGRFKAVSLVLMSNRDILILRRSDKVRTNKGKWSVVSGEVESDNPLETAYNEILQETGITRNQLKLIRRGKPLKVKPKPTSETTIYPHLFKTSTRTVTMNYEHIDYAWIRPEQVHRYDTVPKFQDLLKNLNIKSSNTTKAPKSH